MLGALQSDFPRPRYLLRLEAITFLVGDHAAASRLSRRRARRGDPQSLFISLVSEWSLDPDGGLGRARNLRARGTESDLVGLTRFYLYLERPDDAQDALDAIGEPDSRLMAGVGAMWQRHGRPDRALETLDRALAIDPGAPRAKPARDEAAGELSAVEWAWLPTPAPDRRADFVPDRERVLHMVARSLPQHHAGSTYRTQYLLGAQRQAGVDARVVTECGFPGENLSSTNGSRPAEMHEGIEYLRLPEGPRDERLDVRLRHHYEAASELVEEIRPGVLHPHSDFRNAAVALALRERYGVPVVYEVRGFPEEYLPRRPGSRMLYERFGTRRRIEAECWRRADRIVTLAEVMKDHIASKGVDPDRIHVVPNAVDAERFRPLERDPVLAAKLGIGPRETVLGYVSSLTAPYEGIRYLIESVVKLTRMGKEVKALVVGEGSEREHLMELAKRLGVRDRVIFTGRVGHENLPVHYSLIDVFVIPRTSEATTELVTPLKPLEAMAMELPVVVSGTRALREMIIEGYTGLSYRPDDVSSLVEVVEPLVESPERRAELGRAAREWVVENRSWAHNAERYRAIYAELGVGVEG